MANRCPASFTMLSEERDPRLEAEPHVPQRQASKTTNHPLTSS